MSDCVMASYGSYMFDPVPLMGITKDYTRRGNENKLLGNMQITFSGVLLPNNGVNAPTPSGTDTNVAKLRIMQDQLKDVLSVDRDNLLIVDQNGYVILDVYPRIESLSFDESILVQKSEYSIVFAVQEEEQSEFIDSASDSWESVLNDNGTVTVTHSVSAKGIRGDYDAKGGDTPVNNAKDFVLSKIGQDPALQQFFIQASGFTGYNHTKSESNDPEEGTFSITETWILNIQDYTDDRTINISSTFEPNGDEFITETINGTIQGLSTVDEPSGAGKLVAAEDAFDDVIADEIGFYDASVTSRSKETNSVAGTLVYSVTKSSVPSGLVTNKSIERQFSRNEDGSTTQTITVSAQLVPGASGDIDDVIAYVDANIFDIDNTNPPYNTASGVRISRAATRNDVVTSFSRTDTYIDAGNLDYREEYTINGTLGDDGILQVTVAGTVFGLFDEPTTTSEERFDNAEDGFVTVSGLILTRAQSLADDFDRTLSTVPSTQTIGHNRKAGTVSYSFNFSDKPQPPSGVLNETISIDESGGDPVVAVFPIPGRALGPIFQRVGTRSVFRRTVNLDWTLDSDFTEAQADTAAATTIVAFQPTPSATGGEDDINIVQNKSFSPSTRKYSRTVTWEYTKTGSEFRLTNLIGE